MNTLVLSGNNDLIVRSFSFIVFPYTNKFDISVPYKSCSLYTRKATVVAFLSPNDTVSVRTYDALSPRITAYVLPEGKTDFCNNTNGDVPIPLGKGVHSVDKNSQYEIRSRLIAVEGNCIVKTDQGTFTNSEPNVYFSTENIRINTVSDNTVIAVFHFSENIKRCILIYGNDFSYQIDPGEAGSDKDVAMGTKSEIKISAKHLVVNGEIVGKSQAVVAPGSTIEISTFSPPLSGRIEAHSSNGKQWYRKAVLSINETSTTSFDYFEPPQPTEVTSSEEESTSLSPSSSSSEEERSSFSSEEITPNPPEPYSSTPSEGPSPIYPQWVTITLAILGSAIAIVLIVASIVICRRNNMTKTVNTELLIAEKIKAEAVVNYNDLYSAPNESENPYSDL